MSFSIKLHGNSIPFFIPIYGVHNIYNALFAIAIADFLGFPPKDISKGLREYVRSNMRMNIRKLKGDLTVIDDSFSANLHLMKAAFDVLVNIGSGTKVAILGSMKGIRVISMEAHLELGSYAAMKKIDFIYTFGDDEQWITKAALGQGNSAESVIHFAQKEHTYQALQNLPQGNYYFGEGFTKVQNGRSGELFTTQIW
jgi:UDP-N-acetylmuramoyl-tripeptide--D-alanyl-D-alanine ligase